MSSNLFLLLKQQWLNSKKLCVLMALFVICAGCANKDTKTVLPNKTKGSAYKISSDINLTSEQKKIFYRTGELDKNIPKKGVPAVAEQYSHFLNKGRITMKTFSQRSEDFLGHAREIFRERGMPEELAFLAIVESGYNVTVKSHAGAAGAWQFMPYTGMSYGLHQDWWIDERLDPYESVEAAATYLKRLHGYFDDWLLAIAAYNAGEGKIGRALEGTGAKDFFTLVERNHELDYKAQLRKETIDYVPRFLAICKIMRNLEDLGFEGVDMDQDPLHVRVEAKPGTDLQAMAKVVQMPWSEFKKTNSLHKQYVTHASKNTYVYVPSHKQSAANSYVAKGRSPYAWKTVTVPQGETWSSISKKSRVPVGALKAANGNKPLRQGAKIRIPSGPYVRVPKFTTYLAKGGQYKVKSGETLSGIASKHSTNVKAIMQANNISDSSKIRVGQVLTIPGSTQVASSTKKQTTKKPAKKAVAQKSKSKATSHTVKPGESLLGIALKYDVTTQGLMKANGIKDSSKISIGQVIKIPTGKAVAQATKKTRTHTVKPGESLLGIALKYDVTTKGLMQANGIKDSSKISIGQVIKIPNGKAVAQATKKARTHKVKSGDTFWDIARKYNLSTKELMALNKKSKSSTLRVGETLLVSSN